MNNETVILFDDFATQPRNGEILLDNFFEFYEHDKAVAIVAVKYCGAWLIDNNGYLDWNIKIPPMKEKCILRRRNGWNGLNP